MDEVTDEGTPAEQAGGLGTLPPPDAQPSRPVFRRSTADRVLSGVAGGLARTFAVDAVIVRVVVVVLAITFPPAFIAYLIAWLLVARDGEPCSTTVANTDIRETGGAAFWVGVVLLAVGALAVLDDPFRGDFDLLPLVLIGVGVALWTRDGGGAAATAPPTPPRPSADGAPRAFVAPEPAPPPRPRSPLGAVTIALALIAAGVVAALDQLEGVPIDADPTHLAAVALLVLGLGVMVGAVWGRARWLLLVALLLLPPVLGGAAFRAVDDRFDLGTRLELGDGFGERDVVLVGEDGLPGEVRLLAGSTTIDLAGWSPDEATRGALDSSAQDLLVEVGAGEVIVRPPTDVAWRVVGSVGLGEVTLEGGDQLVQTVTSGGPRRGLEVEHRGGPPGPVVDIVVRLSLGELTIIDPAFGAQELS